MERINEMESRPPKKKMALFEKQSLTKYVNLIQ